MFYFTLFYFILFYIPPGADGVMTSEAILENPALFTSNMDDKNNYRTLVDLAGKKLKKMLFCSSTLLSYS